METSNVSWSTRWVSMPLFLNKFGDLEVGLAFSRDVQRPKVEWLVNLGVNTDDDADAPGISISASSGKVGIAGDLLV